MLKDFIKNEEDAKIALLGTIFADGSIAKARSIHNTYVKKSYLEITHTSKNLDYLQQVKDLLETIEGVKCRITEHNKKTEKKTYCLFRLSTNSTQEFARLRDLIYDSNRIKKFPKEYIDLFSDLSLFLLYLDDGTLRVRMREGTSLLREARVSFCIESFTLEELQYFMKFLKKKYDIDCRYYKYNKNLPNNRGYRIWMNTFNTKKFMEVIDKFYNCVPSMNYKFLKYYLL